MSTRKIDNTFFCVMLFFAICLCCPCPDAQASDQTEPRFLDNDMSGQMEYFIYFVHPDKNHLTARPIYLLKEADEYFLGLKILKELLKGPKDKVLKSAWPPETTLRAFFMDQKGRAWVDIAIDEDSKKIIPFSQKDKIYETLAVYSVVHSICLNLKQVNEVKILINGSDRQLADENICLKHFYTPNMALVK